MGTGNSTHVANAYNKEIYVKVDTEKFYVTKAHIATKAGAVGFEGEWHKIKPGLTAIPANKLLRFTPGAGAQYITVFLDDGKCIAEGFRMKADYSIIVTENGFLKRTQYGKLWVDEQGKRHT